MIRALCCVFLLALTACGPVQSTAYLMDADVRLEAARAANAQSLAPFEWTSANLYLHKAREEVGTSDYENALQYAKKASEFAREALQKAQAAKNEATPAEAVE